MMDLLESAGFSKANPYYIVQQGKVPPLPSPPPSPWFKLACSGWLHGHLHTPPAAATGKSPPRG